MPNIKKYTGAVSINDDVTPTLREPIEVVEPEKWNEMSSSALHSQKIILNNRITMSYQCGQSSLVGQIQAGILRIDAILDHRSMEAADNETHLM